MFSDDPEWPVRAGRRLGRAALLVTTALLAGFGIAYLADSNETPRAQMSSVTEAVREEPALAPRADRLPKAQEAAPRPATDDTETHPTRVVRTGQSETWLVKQPAVLPTDDLGPVAAAMPPIPVPRPAPPPPAVAAPEYPGPQDFNEGPVPERDFAIADSFDPQYPTRRAGHRRHPPILALPFTVIAETADRVERTVVSIGNAVASVGRPPRRY